MNTRKLFLHRRRAQLGVTLIELMVALLLGVLLIGGAVEVFISNRATYAFNEGFSRLQENGRFALDTLNFHGRLAGYLGCLSDVPRHNNLNTPTKLDFNFDEGLRGYEANGTAPGQTFAATAVDPANSITAASWTPPLPAELVGGVTPGVIPGSDVLIIRHASTNSHVLLSPFTSATTVTAVAAVADYAVGDIAIVSDCQKASIFQITNVANGAGGIAVAHVGAGTPGNLTPNWDTSQQYAAGSQLIRGETWVFYVARGASGSPALFQRGLSVNSATTTAALRAEELVEGVETMQVRYGIDAALDGAIDSYVTADIVQLNNWWAQVVAIRVALVLRSPEEYGTEIDDGTYIADEVTFNPVDDRRVRQVFVTTIAVRNRLP